MLNKFTYKQIEYTITGPIEVISDTQLHVETDKGIILVDDTMDIYEEMFKLIN
jgi:hypothetical protein